MILGNIIKNYRKEHNILRIEFAHAAGVSEGYLFIIERNEDPDGDVPEQNYGFICRVAKLMGMKASELVRMMEDE